MKTWIVTATAQVRREYQIEAATLEEAERIASHERNLPCIYEDDISEEIDDVQERSAVA
jgi:hypothetical protein